MHAPAPAAVPALKRVLIIDDQPATSRMVRLALEKLETVSVREENHSRRALATARDFHPDLILLDIEMPEMDGGSVWRLLRADPAYCRTPVIFMTSLITESEAVAQTRNRISPGRAYDPCTRMLAKPVTLSKLTACVTELLSGLCRA